MQRTSLILRAALLAWLGGLMAEAALAVDRAPLDAAYREQLASLAAICDERKLTDEAALTRAWCIDRLPDRQYIFLPPADATKVPATELGRKWREKFYSLRRAQAEKLFALSQEYLAANDSARAYQALYETLREDPDHAAARAVLGYKRADGVWRVPGQAVGVKKSSVAHGFLPDFRAGSYWRVTTPHFSIATTAGPEAGRRFGEQLETLYTVWRQVYFRYWSSTDDLRAQFDKPRAEIKLKKPFDVVLFKSRDEYLRNLSAAEPRIALTQGFYSDGKSTAFFYAGDPRAAANCHHEVTHQLFQESGDAVRDIGEKGSFWIVEGIALYMESLRVFALDGRADHVTLGGWDADRLQFARHHVYNGQFQLPLAELNALTRAELQKREDIKRIYSQSAGLAHYLMDDHGGIYREHSVTWLAGIYAGKADTGALPHLTQVELAAHDEQYKQYLTVSDDHLLRLDQPLAIRNLALGHQPITDKGLAALAVCTNLEWLDLAAAPVTDQGLAHLAQLKKLDQLNLEHTAAGDTTCAWLGKQTQLRELDLSHTRVTDAGLAKLAPLTNLEVLWLTGTDISDKSLPVLLKFKKLKTLELEGTKLSADSLTKLRPVTSDQ